MAIATDHAEVQGWPKELYTDRGAGYERRIRCVWGDRFTLAGELTTYPDSIYPYNTDTNAILDRLRIIPERNSKSSDAGAGKISYNNAILICNYSTRGRVVDGNLVTERLTPAMEGGRISKEDLYWDNAKTLSVQNNPLRLYPKLTYTLRYHQLSEIPTAVYQLPGYINGDTVVTKILGISFAPYFLLYRGAIVDRTLTTAGVTKFDVTHTCSYAYNEGLGWNAEWNPAVKAYAPMYYPNGDLFYKYPWTNFNL